jgi:hypothetical protein
MYVVYGIKRSSKNPRPFHSNDNITFPVHLAPYGNTIYVQNEMHREYAKLSAVGKGYNSTTPYISFPISNLSLTINDNELDIEGINISEVTENGLYPSSDIFPGDIYPKSVQEKWIIYEFSVYRMLGDNYIDTGKKYYQSIPVSESGNLKLKIKYERG